MKFGTIFPMQLKLQHDEYRERVVKLENPIRLNSFGGTCFDIDEVTVRADVYSDEGEDEIISPYNYEFHLHQYLQFYLRWKAINPSGIQVRVDGDLHIIRMLTENPNNEAKLEQIIKAALSTPHWTAEALNAIEELARKERKILDNIEEQNAAEAARGSSKRWSRYKLSLSYQVRLFWVQNHFDLLDIELDEIEDWERIAHLHAQYGVWGENNKGVETKDGKVIPRPSKQQPLPTKLQQLIHDLIDEEVA